MPQALADLCAETMQVRPADRPSLGEVQERLTRWLRQTAGQEQARRELVQVRQSLDQPPTVDQPAAHYRHWTEALAGLDRAAGLDAHLAGLGAVRDQVMRRYADTAIGFGDLELARTITTPLQPEDLTRQRVDKAYRQPQFGTESQSASAQKYPPAWCGGSLAAHRITYSCGLCPAAGRCCPLARSAILIVSGR